MSVEWKVGDRFRLTVEGEVKQVLADGLVCTTLVGSERRGNSFVPAVMAKAERIEPPYEPQVGDIVERHDCVWRIHEVDSETVLCDGSRRFPIGDLTLIVRKGEVYR